MIGHIRRNLIAYLALSVALSGSSYAAAAELPSSFHAKRTVATVSTQAKSAKAYLALVEKDGTLLASKGFASSQRASMGNYELKLSKKLSSSCLTFASLSAGTYPIGEISAWGPAGDGTMVQVWIANSAGGFQDRRFQVAVIC